MKISTKQREMLAFIEKFVAENSYPPTYEEIRAGLNISSKSLVNHHLDVLENAALLTRSPNTPRGIRLTGANEAVRVPFAEQITTGLPAEFPEVDESDAIDLTYDIVPDCDDLYAFKVEGNSMIDALVNDGDVVIIQPQNQAKNGDMVALRLIRENEVMLKRFYRENGHVRLQSATPDVTSMIVDPDAVEVQGKVVAVIRQMGQEERE